jgi:hypothetical protein
MDGEIEFSRSFSTRRKWKDIAEAYARCRELPLVPPSSRDNPRGTPLVRCITARNGMSGVVFAITEFSTAATVDLWRIRWRTPRACLANNTLYLINPS